MEVKVNQEDKEKYGKVIWLCLDRNDNIIGQAPENLVLNTLMYEVKFDDGTSSINAANIIAENMWRFVNDEGHYKDSLHSIVDHKFSKNAIKDGYVFDRQGSWRLHKTIKRNQSLVAIKNGVNLNDDEKLAKL